MTAHLVPRDRLGDYELVRPVGQGGIGQVWLAHDRYGARVAIKLLKPADGTGVESIRSWFHREYRTGRRVESRYIATPFDADMHSDPPWIAFPYVEGRTLRQLIDTEPLSHERVTGIAVQILRGLGDLHAAGLVHRDIKPGNIMIGPGDRVTILDLGIVHDPDATRVTKLAQPGTPAYLAPEARHSLGADSAADMWAFAVTVSEMLCPEVRHSAGQPVQAVRLVHPGWADAVQACLSTDPHRRPSAQVIMTWISELCRPVDQIFADAGDAKGHDDQRYRQLLGLAASLSHSEALRDLAWLARQAGDLAAARTWCQKAADLGNVDAMHGLGWLAQRAGDLVTARTWYQRAADHGNTDAMRNLGWLAQQAGDLVTARTWYQRAADHGNTDAMRNLGWLAQQAGDLASARTWCRKAADLGNVDAMRHLGWLALQSGDLASARTWCRRAADLGNVDAMRNLEWLAQQAGDLATARTWYQKVADMATPRQDEPAAGPLTLGA